jgi:GTPase
MLVKFKSKAAADVLMLDRHAQKVLAPFGKSTANGYFSVGELDDAIGALEATTADNKHHAATQALAQDVELHHAAEGVNHFPQVQEAVDFAAHLFPLLEMMRAARRTASVVTWNI